MAEDADYTPGEWVGFDFSTARSAYDASAGRSYANAQEKGITADSLVPLKIRTQSTAPLVVMTDVTGSMQHWPGVIFSKLPYLDLEGRTYLGADMQISFAANTDLHDSYPLQIREFRTGLALKDELSTFVMGGGAGPDSGCEAYEMGALYYAYNVEMPNAMKPIFIFVADEQPHARVTRALAAKHAKVKLDKDLTIEEVFDALKARYSVYLVYKEYSPDSRREWVRLLGEDRIADLTDPERVVDVIFGILAKETGRLDYFKKEIETRQEVKTPAGKRKVETVYRALNTIHRGPVSTERFENIELGTAEPGAKSTMHIKGGGKKAKSLMGGS